ncbi:MAG TPA: TRAP transporter large permease [Candidatus Avipropionibacterium avicola]|uniref:TRAP transporter large permease n=1 Tax=Candidatus Avipropionibacterium avicola TaxID=2840701 RepID=A0A9D1KNB3_9ACTN|nr:TRAP transporter large permease [Candidatus Avipropionibacterium avicola]
MGVTFLTVSFVVLLLLRVPIAFAMGLASLGYIYWFMPATMPLTIIPQLMIAEPSSFPLMAIPFFVMVGELMNASGISDRLVTLAKVAVGHLRGGMAMVSIVASAGMASFSGSSVANAVGTGSITIPAMKKQGYPAATAAAIESSASSLGTVIPPSISMVVYGSLTGVSIGGLFMAGYVPGVLSMIGLALVVRWAAKRHNVPVEERQPPREVAQAFLSALSALAVPVIIIGGILLGYMTPTEAGAVGAAYTLVVAVVFFRSLGLSDLFHALRRTAVTSGVILSVIATASVLGYIMTYERIPAAAANALLGNLESEWAIMLVLAILLFVLGSFMETNAAIAIIAPIIIGITEGSNLDPLFVGVIVVAALALGVATPPVGVCLFVTAKLARTTIEKTSVAALPFVAVLMLVVLVLALLPEVVLFVPRLFGY